MDTVHSLNAAALLCCSVGNWCSWCGAMVLKLADHVLGDVLGDGDVLLRCPRHFSYVLVVGNG